MFHSGSSIAPKRGTADLIWAYVDGMSCMIPRAPTRLRAVGVRSLSAIPCALNHASRCPTPK